MKYLLFALFLLSAGCVTQKKCLSRFPPQNTTDSIYIEKLKEVPVYINGDTIIMKVPVNCPDQEVAVYENVKLRQVIRILNGKLSSVTEIKADTIIKLVPYVKEGSSKVITLPPVKYTPKFMLYSAVFGWSVLLALLIIIAWKIFKPKISI
jgi:hypothetical protein